MKTVDKRKKWDKIVKQNRELKKGPVVGVGYPANKVENSIIRYATINHFGISIHVTDKMRAWFREQDVFLKKETGEIKIPPRPFLAVTIDVNKEKIFNLKKKLGQKILAGQMTSNQALNFLGSVVTGMVKETISGPFFKQNVPNSDFTAQRKGSDQPLMNHGIMRGATTWEVFPNGKPND